jgi:hypothetical protein
VSRDDDPLGLSRDQRAAAAVATAAAAVDTRTTEVRIAVDPDGAHVTGKGRYCPARLPCLGRPAVSIAVPVVNTRTRERMGEVTGVYCPNCRSMSTDQAADA